MKRPAAICLVIFGAGVSLMLASCAGWKCRPSVGAASFGIKCVQK